MSNELTLQKVADIVGGVTQFTDSDFTAGEIAEVLTAVEASAAPMLGQNMVLSVIIGEGAGRVVNIDLPPFLPAAHPLSEPFFIKCGGRASPLAYFREQLFAFRPLPASASGWDQLALQIKNFGLPQPPERSVTTSYSVSLTKPCDFQIDRPGDQETHPGDPGVPIREKYEALVKRRSKREPGLVTTYFENNRHLDTDIISVEKVVDIILDLYSVEVLELLQKEGHLWNVLEKDILWTFGDRELTIYRAVENILTDRIEARAQAEWDKKHESDVFLDDILEGILDGSKFGRLVGRVGKFFDKAPDKARPWYDVLEVNINASVEDIRAAYRRKIAEYHPDKVAGLGPELKRLAEECSQEINRAYGEAQKARRS